MKPRSGRQFLQDRTESRMELGETFSRVQRIHERSGTHYVGAEGRNTPARSRVQKTVRTEPAQARAKAEGQAVRFPRRCRGLVQHCVLFTDEVFVGKSLSRDLRNRETEAVRVIHLISIVEAERSEERRVGK